MFDFLKKKIGIQTDPDLQDALQAVEVIGKFHRDIIGTSGTRIFGEIFDEEYLSKLTGTTRSDIYDKIRRSDDEVQMLITLMTNPILRANWSIEPATSTDPEENELYKRQADHIHYELFERQSKSFSSFLREILSFEWQGFSVFEKTHMIVKNDPAFGDYIGYRGVNWRSQRTIERWNLNRDGSIKNIMQTAYGDLDSGNAEIPGEFLLVFSVNKIGDNYEGISRLRPIYGNYIRKNLYLKLLPIGIERYAVGTPIGTVPAGKENTKERDIFVEALQKFTSHQNSYLVKPKGWEIDFSKGEFDADKIVKAIEMENLGMARSVVALHAHLGTGGNGGAYALATDFSDLFLSIIEDDADLARDGIQKGVIKEFINFNYGQQKKYPQLKVTGINDKWGDEFATIVQKLTQSKHLTPTRTTEKFLRKAFDLNELDAAEIEQTDEVRKPDNSFMPFQASEKESRVLLAEKRETTAKIKKQLTTAQEELRELMSAQLKKHSDSWLESIENRMKRTSPTYWPTLARVSEMKGQREYSESIKEFLTKLAGKSATQVSSEIPGKSIQFGELDELLKKLPIATQNLIRNEIALLVGTQFADIEKQVLFTLSSSVNTTQDAQIILKDLREARDKYIDGPSMTAAGGNAAAEVYNSARNEIINASPEIEYLEFINDDPQSPICSDLAGKIFQADDPEAKRYYPPLHHNCKSILLPIFKIPSGREVSGYGLKPSNPELEKFITL